MGSNVSCNCVSAEISRLNLKLDRFFENVINTLKDHSAEINNIRENKPYSILVLENIAKDLKEDKLELSRKNDELREQNMNMSHIISDLVLLESAIIFGVELLLRSFVPTCKIILSGDLLVNGLTKSSMSETVAPENCFTI